MSGHYGVTRASQLNAMKFDSVDEKKLHVLSWRAYKIPSLKNTDVI